MPKFIVNQSGISNFESIAISSSENAKITSAASQIYDSMRIIPESRPIGDIDTIRIRQSQVFEFSTQ